MSNKKFLILTAVYYLILFTLVIFCKVNALVEEVPATCPPGSFEVGQIEEGVPICKLEPTGCPYGDSIPMDECDKFKEPESEVVLEQPTIPETPVTSAPQDTSRCGK